MSSLEPFPHMKLDAWQTYSDAMLEHQPSHVFALFSGGNDSTVLTSWAKRQLGDRLDAAVYIDTGTAIPGVRDFVERFCEQRNIPLKVYEAGDAYRRMVRQWGMPGPGAHRYPYVWLKERQLDKLIREHKQHHKDRIMLLTGVRRAESTRRMGTVEPVRRDGATVWVAPLTDWTNADMAAYRLEHHLPQSDVAALLHRSGECNCGAYATPGEREMLQSLFPAWFEETIATAERDAEAAGLPCKWGQRQTLVPENDEAGPMCSGCLFAMEEAA